MLLDQIKSSHLEDVPGLLPIVFPDACLPLPPSKILSALSTGDSRLYADGKWVGCPDLTVPSKSGDVERAMVAFLHTFRDRVAELLRPEGEIQPKRTWTAQFADAAVEDAPNHRLPDFLCTDTGLEFRWPNIRTHGELKSSYSPANKKELLAQLLNGAYLIFSSQDTRRFVISLGFVGYSVRLFIFDRAGLVTTFPFDLHEEPESFVRVMTAVTFATDPAFLGYDTSIVKTPAGRSVVVDGITYKLVQTLFVSDVVRGRGTVCWHARHGDQDFVIKDTWADTSREHTEADILRKAQDVAGVPKVVADVVVEINGTPESTDNLRSIIKPASTGKAAKLHEKYLTIEQRKHRRLVLTPFGQPLSHFASRKELISIFIDAVKAHRELFSKAEIIHRDISINNILLVPIPETWNTVELPPTSPAVLALARLHALKTSSGCKSVDLSPAAAPIGLRQGLLIDLDYALVLEQDGERGPTAAGHRTGTLPFMAIDVLTEGDQLPVHEPRHDLESFLYVLIWICVHYAGPGNVERQNFDIYQSSLACWVTGLTYSAIGDSKVATMTRPANWKSRVLANFAPYFEPLQPCVTEWKDLQIRDEMTYDAVLDVLESALASLDDVEVWSRSDDPEGYGEPCKKRKPRNQYFLDPINEKDEPERDDKDEPPQKFSRSDDGGRCRVVQSEPAPSEKAPRPKMKIIHSMKPKQKQRTIAPSS
ncbi:hypothetical protein B0H15DRAFT_932224 [Mycena belliarum]|uniref:Fungal-type protein kinase domain-containing protein n=1 Tax=Mycena belliarum TaxID=1033014 RepID=A0AAD6TYV0_9AGAR|nr:hypothetical protein B0H15DRAFT_932224 [Mycena belliae]